jgi:transcriptional regulator with XRE-family HTH domain
VIIRRMAEGLTGLAALGALEVSGESGADGHAAQVGARVAAARRQPGTQLGELTGLRKDQISKTESGRRRLDVAELPRFANVLGVTVRHLHSGSAALILANSDFPEGHVRFTLAHELAHHILGDPREIIEEAEGAHPPVAGTAYPPSAVSRP